MAPMCLNVLQLVSLTILILQFFGVVGHHECSPRWDLNVGGSITNFTVWVEPDQVYSIKSPLLYRLTYPRSSLMTWYLQTADTSSMCMLIYILYIKTDGYCDVLGVFAFDDHPNSQGYRYEEAVTYWSGSFDHGYDYFKNEERFLKVEFLKSRYAILQFKTAEYYADVGFVLRVLPLLDAGHVIETYMYNPDLILEINHVDYHKLTEFNGDFLLFGVKMEGVQWGFHFYLLLQSEKYELQDETVMLEFSKYGSLGRVSLTYKPIGETGRESVFESGQLYEENEFRTFWLTVEYNKLSLGTGFEPRKNVRLTSFINGEMDLKYFKVYGDNTITFRVYKDCDETLKRFGLPLAPNTIYHSVSVGSIYTRSWIYRKEYPHQIVVFKVISNLLQTPDCIWEGVTIYRGVSWRRKVAVICGNMEEIHSETSHLDVLIQFHSKADMIADQKFNGAANRFFEIEYRVVKRGPTTSKADLNIGLFLAIFLSGMVVLLAVICCVKIAKKKQAPTVAAQSIGPGHPVQNTGQPIQVNISIDNKGQVVGVPDTVYHGGEVKTDITYTGIPPPPVYEPPKKLYQDISHFPGQIQSFQPALPGTYKTGF